MIYFASIIFFNLLFMTNCNDNIREDTINQYDKSDVLNFPKGNWKFYTNGVKWIKEDDTITVSGQNISTQFGDYNVEIKDCTKDITNSCINELSKTSVINQIKSKTVKSDSIWGWKIYDNSSPLTGNFDYTDSEKNTIEYLHNNNLSQKPPYKYTQIIISSTCANKNDSCLQTLWAWSSNSNYSSIMDEYQYVHYTYKFNKHSITSTNDGVEYIYSEKL